ncbi:MAG: hypothetical protein IIV03_00460, partial [Clostridia bacterium]|nr:hypothetical protein [Clostridia bacterium]
MKKLLCAFLALVCLFLAACTTQPPADVTDAPDASTTDAPATDAPATEATTTEPVEQIVYPSADLFQNDFVLYENDFSDSDLSDFTVRGNMRVSNGML